ncbi:MAG: phosphorylase family protein [Vulcanimicrobiaceae bacterium]
MVPHARLSRVIDASTLTVVVATSLEARAVKREAPALSVVESGVALAQLDEHLLRDAVVSCGLAGGLRTDLPSGTVLIPQSVRRPSGETLQCDAELVETLIAGARRLGFEPVLAPMMTSTTIVRGAARRSWAELGYASVDMETGLLLAPRVAAVRVVLDTPLRELSEDWLHPATAFLRPRNWPEAVWLAGTAPRCARIAARVVSAAFSASP